MAKEVRENRKINNSRRNRETENQKIKLNTEKTRCMIFALLEKEQFPTHLTLKNSQIETVKEMKLLEKIVTTDLKWNKNKKILVKKSCARILNIPHDFFDKRFVYRVEEKNLKKMQTR
jgi:hypothetical protein